MKIPGSKQRSLCLWPRRFAVAMLLFAAVEMPLTAQAVNARGSLPNTSKTTPTIQWAQPAAIVYGTLLSAAQLDATSSVAGTFSYSPTRGAKLGAGAQTLSVVFTPQNTKKYTTATDSVRLTVKPATPALSWATPAAITYGTALAAKQLDAKAKVAGAFAYTPAQGAVLDAGAQTLSVVFTPEDAIDYAKATASVTLTVKPATPKLSWPTPLPLPTGIPLPSTKLNAVAKAPGTGAPVAGSYLYTPDAGTVFSSPGPQTLQVTFTPDDTLDYASAERTQTLTISSFGLAAWGDSLTAGVSYPGNYPAELSFLITLSVENLGIAGQISTQIGVREGAIPTYATVSGGVIPPSGGVTVTFPAGYEPVTVYGPSAGVAGTILGVPGTVSYNSGILTFTRTAPGTAVSAPNSPRFMVDTPYASYIPVFWEGRNNCANMAQVLSDIAAQVASLPAGRNYLVMSVINGDTLPELKGGSSYNAIMTLNKQLASIYKKHYLDIRKLLVASYDPAQATDASDYAHDVPPTSLRLVQRQGTLSSAIGPADTTFTVKVTEGQLSAGCLLNIDTGANAETTVITSVSGNTVTVVRGFAGAQTSHAAGVAVEQTDYIHLNAQGYQVVADAVAEYFSAYEASK